MIVDLGMYGHITIECLRNVLQQNESLRFMEAKQKHAAKQIVM